MPAHTTSFESGLDGRTVVRTAGTLFFGLGFEGISTPAARNTVMDYLLGSWPARGRR